MKHFLLIYGLAHDYYVRRPAYREAHLTKAWASHAAGRLMLGGAVQDPADTAMLLFTADDPSVVEDFARTDPYVLEGLVRTWRVREWVAVVGDGAASPVTLPR